MPFPSPTPIPPTPTPTPGRLPIHRPRHQKEDRLCLQSQTCSRRLILLLPLPLIARILAVIGIIIVGSSSRSRARSDGVGGQR